MLKKANRLGAIDYLGYWMILPFYLIFLFIYMVPIFETLYNSFMDYDLFSPRKFIGLNNYISLLKDNYFIIAVKNTLVYVVFNLSLTMILGLLFAIMLNSKLIKTGYARIAFFLPHIASMVSVSIIWIWLFDVNKGFINYFIGLFGIKSQNWLADPKLAMPAIILMSVWKWCGYNMLIYLSGLQSIPEMYNEAATVDGASKFQIFRHITLPLLSPTTFFLFITGMINSFNIFEQVNVMTNGGPLNATTTIVHQIYIRAFTQYRTGYASAQSVVLILIILIPIIFSFRKQMQSDDLSL